MCKGVEGRGGYRGMGACVRVWSRDGQYIDIIVYRDIESHDNRIVVVLQLRHIVFTSLVVLLHKICHTLTEI